MAYNELRAKAVKISGADNTSMTKALGGGYVTFLLLSLFAVFMVYPLGYVLLKAFYGQEGVTLRYFYLMVESEYFREVIANSLHIAIAVTLLCSVIAIPIALLMSRWRVPCHLGIHSLLLLPLILPPFVGVLGVRQIFGLFGTLNLLLMKCGFIVAPIPWLGENQWSGIVVLQVLHLVPILYLSVLASLRNAQIGLEEAAAVAGASPMRVLTKITLPLALPGWFAGSVMVFVASFTDLGTPLLFEYRHVIPVQIFNMLADLNENRVGYAFVLLTCSLSIILFYLTQGMIAGRQFTSGGRVFFGAIQRSARELSKGKLLCTMVVLGVYIALTLMPHIGVLTLSVSGRWFMTPIPSSFTFEHYRALFNHPLTIRSFTNSIMLSAIATILTVVVGYMIAYRVLRTTSRLNRVLELCSLVPLAVPGIVFAFGYVGAFSGTPLNSRINPFPLLIAAYLIRRSPYMVRSLHAGLQEVSISMEESAQILGASPLRVARSIVFPLMKRHIAAGALLTFIYCMLEVSDGLLLALEEKFYPVSKAMYALMGRPDGIEVASALGVLVMLGIGSAFFLAEYLLIAQPRDSSRTAKRARRLRRGRRTGHTILALLLTSLMMLRYAEAEPLVSSQLPATRMSERELVVVSPHWEGIKREFARAFKELRRKEFGEEVEIRWLDVGGTSDIVKYITTQFHVNPAGAGVDIMFGGGTDSFAELDNKGFLEALSLPPSLIQTLPSEIQGVSLRSARHSWYSVSVSTFGFLYNPKGLAVLGLSPPTTWLALADRRYFGQISAADPRKSGSMHAVFEIILQGYGWDTGWAIIRNIARNVRNFSGTASQVGKELALGEVSVGIVIDSYGTELVRRLGEENLVFTVPTDFPAITGDAIAILKGAPHYDLAEAFVRFSLSEAGQRLISSHKGSPGGPVNYDLGKLPVLPALFSHSQIASQVKGNPYEWQSLLRYDSALGALRWNLVNDLFGAFVIDIHDRLVGAPSSVSLRPIAVNDRAAKDLVTDSRWRNDPLYRSNLLSQWTTQARDEFRVDSPWTRYRGWIPVLLFFLSLIVMWRSSRRTRRSYRA